MPISKERLRPQIQSSKANNILAAQNKQKRYHDLHANKPHPALHDGDQVRYLSHENKWKSAKIKDKRTTYPRSYNIINDQNHTLVRNRKHIFKVPTNKPHKKATTDKTKKQSKQTNETTQHQKGQYTTRYGRKIIPRNQYTQ